VANQKKKKRNLAAVEKRKINVRGKKRERSNKSAFEPKMKTQASNEHGSLFEEVAVFVCPME